MNDEEIKRIKIIERIEREKELRKIQIEAKEIFGTLNEEQKKNYFSDTIWKLKFTLERDSRASYRTKKFSGKLLYWATRINYGFFNFLFSEKRSKSIRWSLHVIKEIKEAKVKEGERLERIDFDMYRLEFFWLIIFEIGIRNCLISEYDYGIFPISKLEKRWAKRNFEEKKNEEKRSS